MSSNSASASDALLQRSGVQRLGTTDAIVVLLALIGMLAALHIGGSSLEFVAALLVAVPPSVYRDQHAPSPIEMMPPPILVDLNADGKQELVVAQPSPSPLLRCFSVKQRRQQRSPGDPQEFHSFAAARDFAGLELEMEAKLGGGDAGGGGVGDFPVALAAGFLDAYEKRQAQRRYPVVVVVTNAWRVLCFDRSLRLMWQTAMKPRSGSVALGEVAVLVTPKCMRTGDRGAVIVGGRQVHSSATSRERDDGDSERLHFDYFALDGRTGAVRWKNQAGDFAPEVDAGLQMVPQHELHADEVDWRKFRLDILDCLPHVWNQRDHTTFTLAQFDRQRSSLHGRRARGASGSGQRDLAPDSDIHMQPANVLVAHVEEGIEVIHLYSGHPVCTVSLLQGALHDDLNGDGVIDHIQGIAGEHTTIGRGRRALPSHLPRCLGLITSGMPQRMQLANMSLCSTRPLHSSALFSEAMEHEENAALAVSLPILANTPTPAALFLTSQGVVSLLALEDNARWQTATRSSWNIKEDHDDASDALRKRAFRPSLTSFSLRSIGEQSFVLALGESHAAVLQADSGREVSSFSFDDYPVSDPVIGDFNNDGWNDILICTTSGIIGFELRHRFGRGMLVFVLSFLIVLLSLVVFFRLSDEKRLQLFSWVLGEPNFQTQSALTYQPHLRRD